MLISLLLSSSALAAEVTDLPPFLRGDVNVGYRMEYQTGSLIEPDQGTEIDVGKLILQDHRVHIGGSFGIAPMAAVTLEFPITVKQQISFSDSQSMVFDPTLGQGSMAAGVPLDAMEPATGSGLSGVWMGLQVSPFSQRDFPQRGNQASWLLDVAYRTADTTHFYDVGAETRGAGTGASALRVRSGFSKQLGQAQPWMQATYLRQGSTNIVLTSATGGQSEATVINADSLVMMSGIEVHTFADPVTKAEFAVDFRMGFAYQSWQDLPSGLYLPDILSSTQGSLSTMGEQTRIIGGVGVYWRIFEYLKFNMATDVSYVMPTQLENPYLVQTGSNTVRFDARGELVILFR